MQKIFVIGSIVLVGGLLAGCGENTTVDTSVQKVSTIDKQNMARLPDDVKNSGMSDKRKADIARQMGIRPGAATGQ